MIIPGFPSPFCFGFAFDEVGRYSAVAMERAELLDLAERVLRLPTAPYHEHAVRDFVMRYCRKLGVQVETDRVGNVIVKHQRQQAETRAPLVFVAHMDHPGFEMLDGNRAEFLGGVPKEMFARGGRVRIYTSQPNVGRRRSTVKATIRRFVGSGWPKRKIVELAVDGTVRKGDVGMWDVPAFRVSGGRLQATAIDDLLGSGRDAGDVDGRHATKAGNEFVVRVYARGGSRFPGSDGGH
jgi:hypothetical protein